jgi:UDP-N-acetylmuramyl pentapeptide phosphotransferase/UDP-N-acetylglucosamine-1-phosphate transferase
MYGPMIRRGVSHKVRPCWSSGTKAQWRETRMYNIFWIIGVIVVVLVVLSFLGLR